MSAPTKKSFTCLYYYTLLNFSKKSTYSEGSDYVMVLGNLVVVWVCDSVRVMALALDRGIVPVAARYRVDRLLKPLANNQVVVSRKVIHRMCLRENRIFLGPLERSTGCRLSATSETKRQRPWHVMDNAAKRQKRHKHREAKRRATKEQKHRHAATKSQLAPQGNFLKR